MNDFHRDAVERFNRAWTADEDNRSKAESDLEFLTGEGQWDDEGRRAREAAGRPVLTINRMPQFLRQVTGDLRKMNPAVKVSAGDMDATREIADIYEGIIRQIEYASGASSIYERAAESAAACGLGHFRIVTEYCDDVSFDQELKVKWIPNPFAVIWDDAAKDPTRRDAQFCFVTEWMSEADYKKKFPKAPVNNFDGRDDKAYWMSGERVRVAEYWWKEATEKTLYLLETGQVVEKMEGPLRVVAERKATAMVVKHALLSGGEVLREPAEWPGQDIPIIAVTGEEVHDGERVVRSGVIRYAKDAQRMYNYWRSAQTEVVALQPKAPFLATPRQIEGFEAFWKTANTDNRSYLPYNPDPNAPGAPQRQQPPVPASGMMQEIALAADDMKATTGIYDAALGDRSNETSGVAIRQRQMEADVSTSIYADNMAKAIEQAGRIFVDLIPKIYDGERVVRILGEDGAEDLAAVNAYAGFDEITGQPLYANSLETGKYAVKVSTGPSYSTRRQESAEQMIQFIQAVPQAGQVAGDLIAKAQDWPGADMLAERLKSLLPPGLADEEEDIPPEQQQQMMVEQQRQQQMQAAVQEMEIRKKQAETEEAEAQALEAQAKAEREAIELEQARLQLAAMTQAGLQQPQYAGE